MSTKLAGLAAVTVLIAGCEADRPGPTEFEVSAPVFVAGGNADFNLGTADGASCDPALSSKLKGALDQHAGYSNVLNGRFKGGYITRHYAAPAEGIEAVQLEMSQRLYMDENTFAWDSRRAPHAQAIIRALLEAAIA